MLLPNPATMLELDFGVELQTRLGWVRHSRRLVEEVREDAARGERHRVEELVLQLHDPSLEVAPAISEIIVGDRGDRGLLADVLPVAPCRPVTPSLGLTELQSELGGPSATGGGEPVVRPVGYALERLAGDQLGIGQPQRR